MRLFLYIIFLCLMICHGKIHKLKISDDQRKFISLTSFGYLPNGYLSVNFTDFTYKTNVKNPLIGFTLEKVVSMTVNSRMILYQDKCLLEEESFEIENDENIIFFIMDFEKNELRVNCSKNTIVYNLRIYEDIGLLPHTEPSKLLGNTLSFLPRTGDAESRNPTGNSCFNLTLPITGNSSTGYQTKFVMFVPTENEQSLYKLYFYSCSNHYENSLVTSSFVVEIEEHNVDSYLSAGEMPLPELYVLLSIIFCFSALFWSRILVNSRHAVYNIHYLMGSLVILKALGLLFHGMNYYYISVKGEPVSTWAILYYVIHLLRGLVLFITIILIGTGWTFIKHILSPKDKKIFMVVIPLQVFSNVAEIIIAESEEGDAEHSLWLNVFIFVDLICCIAIFLPIVWSIKHLQDASQTDGKAIINLIKLKLFRHFYIMIVCYIYFTRIIVYLLQMTVPFQYAWLNVVLKEIATLVFFVLTGYKFRPASANVYFHVPEECDNDMDIVISKCGITEGLTKLSKMGNDFGDDDKDTLLIYKRESSHDYD